MKKLYVIKIVNNIKVDFSVVEVISETDTDYITELYFNDILPDVQTNFPKNKLNTVLYNGYVTDKKNRKNLKKQLDYFYKKLDETHKDYIEGHTRYKEINDTAYKYYMKQIDKD